MKCSLLSLSSYLDDELEGGKRGELEAHLVGCQRCSSGLGHLREEVGRISSLAPVHVPDDSARGLMEQLGLLVPGEPLPPRMAPRAATASFEGALPWLHGEAGKALPWRAPKGPLAGGSAAVPPATPAPSISLRGRPAEAPVWQPPAQTPAAPITMPERPIPAAQAPAAPAPSFATPAPVAPTPVRPAPLMPTPVAKAPATPAPVPPTPVTPAPVTQAPVAPAAAAPVPVMPTQPEPAAPQRPFAAPVPRPAIRPRSEPMPDPSPNLELDSVPDLSQPVAPARPSPVARLKERWAVQRALARTSSREDDAPEVLSEQRSHPWAGRHAEAPAPEAVPEPDARRAPVAGRHSLPLMARHDRAPEPAAVAAGNPALERLRDTVQVAARNRPLLAFVGSLVLLAILVFSFGRSSSPVPPKTRTPAAGVQSAAPAVPVVPPAAVASAPPGTTAVQLNDVKSLGTGATGMQVKDIRYGNHPGSFFRIVFDIAPGAAAQAGTPHAAVGFKDPTTLWVILDGVAASGPPGKPADATTVSSVTQVDPAPAGKTIYEFKLTHAVTFSSDYLPSPLRLVLDLK